MCRKGVFVSVIDSASDEVIRTRAKGGNQADPCCAAVFPSGDVHCGSSRSWQSRCLRRWHGGSFPSALLIGTRVVQGLLPARSPRCLSAIALKFCPPVGPAHVAGMLSASCPISASSRCIPSCSCRIVPRTGSAKRSDGLDVRSMAAFAVSLVALVTELDSGKSHLTCPMSWSTSRQRGNETWGRRKHTSCAQGDLSVTQDACSRLGSLHVHQVASTEDPSARPRAPVRVCVRSWARRSGTRRDAVSRPQPLAPL